MNEWIKEIILQVGGLVHDDDGNELTPMLVGNELEKFAELIVRECMEVASPNYMSTPEDSVYYVEQAINRIAKHFGVEEK